MGCSSSRVFVVNTKIPGQGPEALDDFDKICLTQDDINVFYSAFRKFDANGDGNISLVEFLVYLNIEETPLTREVFNEIDHSKDRKMNFREFTLYIWNYCVRGKAAIADFAFDIFDTDNSEELNESEAAAMVSAIYGGKKLDVQLQRLLKKIDKSRDGIISKKEFLLSSKQYPALLFPAYSMQASLRSAIGGTKFWEEKEQAADSIFKRKEVKALFKRRKTRRNSESTPAPTPDSSITGPDNTAQRRPGDDKSTRRNSRSASPNNASDDMPSVRSEADGSVSQKPRRRSHSAAPHSSSERPSSRQRRSSEPDASLGVASGKKTATALERRRHTSASNRAEVDAYVGIGENIKNTKKVLPSLSGKRPPIAPAEE